MNDQTNTEQEEEKETVAEAQVRVAKEKLAARKVDPERVGQHYKWQARRESGAKELPKQQYPKSGKDAKMDRLEFEAMVYEQEVLLKEADRAHRVAVEVPALPRVKMIGVQIDVAGGMTKPGAAKKE